MPRTPTAFSCRWRLALAGWLLLIAGAADAAPTPTLLRRGNGPEPATLDAHRAQDLAAHNILRDLYEGLVSEDAAGQVIAGIAERWEIDDQARRYTFHLRPGLRWSNGSALTADQVVASFRRALDPATQAPLAPMLAVIAGADAVLAGRRPPATLAVEAPDPRTVVIRLDRPAPLLKLLLLPIAYPVYLPAVSQLGTAHTRPGHLVGNGAYRLIDWQPQSSIELTRNAAFHAAATVAIERVSFRVTEDAASEARRFQAGDLDLTESAPPGRLDRLRLRFGSALHISPYLGSFFFGLNVGRGPLAGKPGLREALALAIDREILTRYITGLGETPAYGLVPPTVDGYTAQTMIGATLSQAEREARARTLYAAAGYRADHPLSIEIRYNTSTAHRRLALAVAAMWREALGARVTLRNEEWKSFVATRRERRITQVFRGGWIADIDDPLSFLALFDGDQALNWSGWIDAEYQDLLEHARTRADPAERLRILARAERRLLDSQVIVPLYFYTSKHLLAPNLRGFEANPLDHHASRWLYFESAGASSQ